MFRRKGVWWTCIRHNGRKIQKSLETPDWKLAQAIEAKIRADITEGKFFDKLTTRSFKDFMDRFMREHGPRVSKGMRIRYKVCLNSLMPFFENYSISEINPFLISQYKVKRREAGKKPATINRELAMLSKAFSLAVKEWGWAKENPLSKVSKEKEDNQKDRWLTREEEERLLSHCPQWLRSIVLFDLHTGMRCNEVLSMEWSWVDLFRQTLTIPGAFAKNGKPRTIPLNKSAMSILVEKSKVRSLQSKVVFFNEAGKKRDIAKIGNVFRQTLKKAGIEDFSFHCLRHTFATRLAQAGVDLYKVSKLLGHRDIGTTQRYAHHYPESLRDGVDILEKSANFDYILTTLEKKEAGGLL
ncbi:MAG: site-specific integrase [Nitrospinae bacterium]|nr:site-specific integrase [Nitrospinota bacterium]